MAEPQKTTLSLEEAADVLKVGVPTIEELITRGALSVRDESGERCVLYEDLLSFIRASQRASTEDGDPPAGQLDAGLV